MNWSKMDRSDKREYFLENIGLPNSKMAAELGTTRSAIAGEMWRMGICKKDILSGKAAALKVTRRRTKKFRPEPYGGLKSSLPAISEARTSGPARPAQSGPYRPLRIPFADRKRSQCSWGLWPNETLIRNVPPADMVVCGMPVAVGSKLDWCSHHITIGTRSLPARVRR